MEKVILINPPAEKIEERHYEQTDIPRIGLAYLASYLLHLGISCHIIDAKYERLDIDNILNIIDKEIPCIVGFTAMTSEVIDAAKLASKIKQKQNNILTVIGGPHATVLPVETLEEFPGFDVACIGEGEYVLGELVEAVRRKEPLYHIAGIAYRDKNSIININKLRPAIEHLDDLPFPAWSLVPPAKQYPIISSRGCPFRCNFCMRVLGDHIRFRNPDLVVKEMLEVYEKYEPRIFMFYDEMFGLNKEKTDKILNNIIESGINKKVKLRLQTRVDVVDEKLLSKMKEAGFVTVSFGIESGNEEILKASGKNITKENARNAVGMAKKIGLETRCFFIMGHPNETEQTIKDTIDFALELNPTAVSFAVMTPYPGTEIAKLAEKRKGGYKLLSKNWSEYKPQTNAVLELDNISKDTLQKYQLIAYVKFYLLKFSFIKTKHLLKAMDIRSIFLIFLHRIFKLIR